MATRTESGADLMVMDEQGQHARQLIDMEQIRHMQYIPKSKDIWHHQYIYRSEDRGGDVIPLTGETIDSFLSAPVYGRNPHIDVKYIKKCVIVADALFLEEFISPFLIKCKAGNFFNIFPHMYVVPCNDPLVRQTSVGFVEIINKSMNALTLGSLLANHELFFELLSIQPDSISINIGLSDMKQENISWHSNQIPKEYIKKLQELLTHMQTYFIGAGSRGAFAENLTYTFNLLPIYVAADSVNHNLQTINQTVQHTNLWGTTYYGITREFYKQVSDEINKRLHNCKVEMFNKFQVIMLNPTPKWSFEGLHVDGRSGLPHPEIHQKMLQNFFYCLARVVCNRRICTLGNNACRSSRNIDEQLFEGCTMLYMRDMREHEQKN